MEITVSGRACAVIAIGDFALMSLKRKTKDFVLEDLAVTLAVIYGFNKLHTCS